MCTQQPQEEGQEKEEEEDKEELSTPPLRSDATSVPAFARSMNNDPKAGNREKSNRKNNNRKQN